MIEAGAGETPLRGGNPGFAGETGDFAHLSEANVRGTDYFGARPLDGGPGGGVNAYPYQLARRRPDAPLFEGVYQTRLEKILARYPDRQAALLPVLNLAQEVRGWVSPEALTRVAEILELSPAYVRGVATFYTMYNLRPVGRYLIQVCTNVCCNVCGADEVYEAFLEALGAEPGEITADGLFTVMEVECLGACGFPTAVQINDRYFENVSVRDVPAVLERLRGEWRTARAQDGEAEDRGVALVAVRPAARAAVAPQTP
ncbi:MAG: NADH-quinone oxidoreductase subunit NuoE, partial [Longimicrobiales bacterium]